MWRPAGVIARSVHARRTAKGQQPFVEACRATAARMAGGALVNS